MQFKTQPMKHQGEILPRMLGNPGFALFWEMGCGKTKPIVDEICHLWTEGLVDCVVIVSDKGCYRNWPNSELPKHKWDSVNMCDFVYRSGSTKAVRQIEQLCRTKGSLSTLPVICINVEAFSSKSVLDVVNLVVRRFKSIYMVVDESTSIKSHDAERTKRVTGLGRRVAYRRILTGTPMTQNPLDLYAQMNFLSPDILGFESFYTFRARYGVMEQHYMGPGRTFQKLVGFKNTDELLSKIAPYSSRLLKTECLDLPEKIYLTREVELTKEQKTIYDKVQAEGLVQLKESTASASTALGVIIKLRQITSGYIKDDEDNLIPIQSNRIHELERLLESTQGKAIIWCAFKEDVRRVCELLGPSAVHYYGDTSDEDRAKALEQFNDPDSKIRYFVGTPKTGGKSLTLTIANTVIYYSNDYSLESRLQSEDRAHRFGQKNAVTYVDMVSPGTVDETVLAILKGKEELSRLTLKRLTEIIAGGLQTPSLAQSREEPPPDFWAPLCAPSAKAQHPEEP